MQVQYKLKFHVVGHFLVTRTRVTAFFGEHDVVGGARVAVETILTEEIEFALEVRIGERTRVLEITQTLVGEEMQITVRDDGFEGALAAVGDTMLFAREPAKKVGGAIIEFVGDEMVTIAAIWFARFLVNECRSLAIESDRHDDMTRSRKTLPHARIGRTTFIVYLRRSKGVFHNFPLAIKEIAVRMSPADVVLRVQKWHLFAALVSEPRRWFWGGQLKRPFT